MTDNPSKKNLHLEQNAFYAQEKEAFFYPSYTNTLMNTEDESDSGTGIASLSAETLSAYLMALLNKERRERLDGQKKFGICPYTDDPNHLLGKKNSCLGQRGEVPKMHPLLAQSQQFNGDDPSMSAIPVDNTEAVKRFPEKRLENQQRLQKNLGLSAGKKVTLVR